jgi:hypothetical protein
MEAHLAVFTAAPTLPTPRTARARTPEGGGTRARAAGTASRPSYFLQAVELSNVESLALS